MSKTILIDDTITIPRKVLTGLIAMLDEIEDDSEGCYPTLDSGCITCTAGTVPDKYNTGLCALHMAKELLKVAE